MARSEGLRLRLRSASNDAPLISPSLSPNGEAIRRHVARGVAYAALKSTPSA